MTNLKSGTAVPRNEKTDRRDDAPRRDAIRGCLLGGAVGDALGAPVEFLDLDTIRSLYEDAGITGYVEFGDSGAITDDTQMTLFTAEGILRANTRIHEMGSCDPVAIMRHACLRWLKTQEGMIPECPPETLRSGRLIGERALHRRRAPGATCLSALECGRGTGRARNNSKGCGTVMRMAPAGLFFEPESAWEYGCRFSSLTHGHPTAITAGGAFAMLIALLLQGEAPDAALDGVEKHLAGRDEAHETLAALRKARAATRIDELGEGWVAEEALAIGIFCAFRHAREFRSGVLAAVNISGDSDSTGSIAGNLLGVMLGESAIPPEWLSRLREQPLVSEIADDLYLRFECGPDGHATEAWQKRYPGF